MELIKIDWAWLKEIGAFVSSLSFIWTAIGTFLWFVWKMWGKKKWRQLCDYIQARLDHWKKSRNTEQTLIKEMQTRNYNLLKEIAATQETHGKKIDKIHYEIYPNGGKNLIGKVDTALRSIDEVKENQRQTRELLDLAMWESDSDGKIFYTTRAFCELFDASCEEVTDYSWIGFIIPEHRDRVKDAWEQAVETASPFREEFTIRRQDGMYQKVFATSIEHKKNETGGTSKSIVKVTKLGDKFDKL